MKDITTVFSQLYFPKKALVIFEKKGGENDVYVEAYDMDENGRPYNAQPLSAEDADSLAKRLQASAGSHTEFLIPKGLLPANVLYLRPHSRGYAVWYTAPQKRRLLFKDGLSIPPGEAWLPALVWKASQRDLMVYATTKDKGFSGKTPLCHAPFFNVYREGAVCMGTVDIDIADDCCLEDFMQQWEDYFFKSYFSHMVEEHLPVNGNMVQLWQQLVKTGEKFPLEKLLQNGQRIHHLIS